ncbi:U2 snRNP complex subunit [Martiniozyma asiatica (nom. inval.)]|nr:U2 snRNP complex subunit [Martiniozyma asiatica]
MAPTKRTRQSNPANKGKAEPKQKRQHLTPSHTLFVANLDTHIGVERMKTNLFLLFSTYTDVIEIQYPKKGFPGQGWVVVSSVEDAHNIIKELDGFEYFDKPLRVQFARKESHLIDKLTSEK